MIYYELDHGAVVTIANDVLSNEQIVTDLNEATNKAVKNAEKIEKLEAIIKKLKLLMTDEMQGMAELEGRIAWRNKRNKYLEELKNDRN